MKSIASHARAALASAAIVLAASGTANAEAHMLPAPEGDVLLTVSGNIEVTNVDNTAAFDLELLQTLPSETITTATIWTSGINDFTGVPLKEFLEMLGVEEGTIRATAINDYAIEFPVEDGLVEGPVLTYLRNGETMSVRDKGPVWLLFPFDDMPEFQSEKYYSRSIWQLDRIEILD